ncbi:MAG: 4Fe-4S dicluster domain-containing protein [Christensenellales bacterium]
MNQTTLTADQIKRVKGEGFLHNRATRRFSARVITENGTLQAHQLAALSEAAARYGNGTVAFTVRMTVEVPGIEYENIGNFQALIAKVGLKTGGTGAKVRPVVSCKGTTCVFGLCDTQRIAKQMHDRFYEGFRGTTLPHKFKIAVGGCPNNCVKPDLNDIGIVGQRIPIVDFDACRGCKVCGMVKACPMDAIEVRGGKVAIDSARCIHCGRCVGACPFHIADNFEDRFKVYVGGMWGKSVRMGAALDALFTEEEALDVVERAILLYQREGAPGERFGKTCDRIGMDAINEMLTSAI